MFKNNKTLLIITIIAVVNALGYGIVIPILYSYSKHFGLSDWQNGLLFSVFSLCAFIATPIIGKMSDKYGRRPLLLISVGGTIASFFMQAFAPSGLFLFIARALDGITAGNGSVAAAIISDTTKPEMRAKGFGIMGAAFGFGFVLGPAISAVTAEIWYPLPFVIAGVLTLIAWLLIFFLLPETNPHIGQVEHKELFDLKHLWHGLFDQKLGGTFWIIIIYFIAFSCSMMYGFQPFARNVLNLSVSTISLLFVLFGVVGLLMQSFFVQMISKAFGVLNTFKKSILVVALAFGLMFISNNLYFFIAACALLAIANSLVQPLSSTLLSLETDSKNQGNVMGMSNSYMNVGQIIGPIIGGVVATHYIRGVFAVGLLLVAFCGYIAHKIQLDTRH